MKILATAPIDQTAIDILSPYGEIITAPDDREDTLVSLAADAEVIVVRGVAQITETIIEAADKLKVIGRTGVGINNIDIASATARGIPVVFTPGANSRAVAEAAMAFLLALAKRVTYWDGQTKANEWSSRYHSMNDDLEGKTLGIVGFGNIGQQLARLATPFDMKIIACDPYTRPDIATELGVEMVPLDELIKRSKYISLHTVLTPETEGMINDKNLQYLQTGSYLINLSRGEAIDSLDTILEALNDGRLAGAGLDVFVPEPADISHPIFKHPNFLTAPHVASLTKNAIDTIHLWMANDIKAVLEGERPKNLVNPEVL
ncbi:MAG: 3-phosphoglycerate dehydrogenase [Planctomycetaceae bacterium]|jgi:D-3-phosphoglycerate dehydrogenase / 2-oxoglutarate reductase|nr:3-phosphoglycerate dehydrogenase [Planctomycetaceae bacterium]